MNLVTNVYFDSQSDFPLTIISVAYRDELDRSITTWHDIKYSNMISTDEESDPKVHQNQYKIVYNKDTDIYKFDIDKFYEMVLIYFIYEHKITK